MTKMWFAFKQRFTNQPHEVLDAFSKHRCYELASSMFDLPQPFSLLNFLALQLVKFRLSKKHALVSKKHALQ